jgi:hypothetical protein
MFAGKKVNLVGTFEVFLFNFVQEYEDKTVLIKRAATYLLVLVGICFIFKKKNL